jgi:hypothetical protein
MAEKTTIDSVGPVAAQLKNELSSLEKTQIAGIRNLGSISTRPGVLNGSVANSITNLNNHQKSAMELGANVAAKLERAGAFSKGAEKILTTAVSSTVTDKITLPQKFPKNPIDMGRLDNRLPSFKKQSPYEKIQKKKNKLVGEADFNYGGLSFPPDLKNNAASYIELWFWSYERESPTTEGTVSPDLKVWLPIPENFTINHEIKYQERDTGMLGDVMQSDAGKAAMSTAGTIGDKLSAGLEKMQQSTGEEAGRAIGEVAKRAAFAALNSADEVLGGLAGRVTGEIPNPHPTVFFKGLELRQFTWTWKLVPRSVEEAAALKAIIILMKQRVLPEKAGSFLKYPSVLKPSVKPNADLYGNFMKSAVKTFSVNYTAEGTSAFFVDGNPVAINLILTFQEMENMTAGDV